MLVSIFKLCAVLDCVHGLYSVKSFVLLCALCNCCLPCCFMSCTLPHHYAGHIYISPAVKQAEERKCHLTVGPMWINVAVPGGSLSCLPCVLQVSLKPRHSSHCSPLHTSQTMPLSLSTLTAPHHDYHHHDYHHHCNRPSSNHVGICHHTTYTCGAMMAGLLTCKDIGRVVSVENVTINTH